MAKYVWVNQDTCIGCGTCEGIAPDIFGLDEEGLAFVTLDNNQGIVPIPDDKLEDVQEAMEDCPTESVKVAEQPYEENA
ncbi:ferredoxin [Pullulanibacillus pueri]|uniref:Ferredoxin n=1 Tax=Pullulanibacillus pueri TaxID=1437324 RepID=A0A8J2ZUX0_9BACL|nr:ferredoxin [Pullulanibacillus pueri]MBM7681224.1 ferredoxin [Pullulanibacillus pueri]GGH77975.1 ferredoxin [Pullulanibacillus pueri]